jgi:hypothetical protein
MEAPKEFELTGDERIWLVSVPVEIAVHIAAKVRELEEKAEWLPGASCGPVGDGTFYLSATYYLPGMHTSFRPIFHVTDEGATQVSWDDLDRLKAAASLRVG